MASEWHYDEDWVYENKGYIAGGIITLMIGLLLLVNLPSIVIVAFAAILIGIGLVMLFLKKWIFVSYIITGIIILANPLWIILFYAVLLIIIGLIWLLVGLFGKMTVMFITGIAVTILGVVLWVWGLSYAWLIGLAIVVIGVIEIIKGFTR